MPFIFFACFCFYKFLHSAHAGNQGFIQLFVSGEYETLRGDHRVAEGGVPLARDGVPGVSPPGKF